MFKVRPWLLVAFLCVVSAAGAAGATRKLLEARDAVLFQILMRAKCAQPSMQTRVAMPTQPVSAQVAMSTQPAEADEASLGSTILDLLPGYDTLEEAGVHAIALAYRCSRVYECGGVIARRASDGKYVVGPVTSSYAGDHVQFPTRVPDGGTLAGSYHTHPCNPDSHFVPYFSPDDLIGQITSRTVGFMGDLCTGKVHEFDPRTMRPDVDEVEPGVFVTQGKIIGQIVVEGASVEPHTGI